LFGVTAIAAGEYHTVALIGPLILTALMDNSLTLLWPTAATGFRVESALSLAPPVLWSNEAGSFQTNAGSVSIALPISGARKFYRLVKP